VTVNTFAPLYPLLQRSMRGVQPSISIECAHSTWLCRFQHAARVKG
jgi:hypothetical protein